MLVIQVTGLGLGTPQEKLKTATERLRAFGGKLGANRTLVTFPCSLRESSNPIILAQASSDDCKRDMNFEPSLKAILREEFPEAATVDVQVLTVL